MASTAPLWQPFTLGNIELDHRLAMSPMTRSRANADGTPGELAKEYYTQRASIGLIITEGLQPSDDGQGYMNTPGIYTDDHIAGWSEVIDAVHDAGGHMFLQFMHVGRMAHPDNTPHGRAPVAPSAIAAGIDIFTPNGMQPMATPREIATDEIPAVIEEFRVAAAAAIAAGADGVELHGANAYLLHQFLAPSANQRTDQYGGSVENRARFVIEVAKAVADEIGADRTGIRLSPGLAIAGIDEGTQEEVRAQYRYLVAELAKLDLVYININHVGDDELLREFREIWPNAMLVLRSGREREQIADEIEAGLADIAPLGKMALANPDVVERLRTDAPFNVPNPETFYGGDAVGYTDYPTLQNA